MNTEEVKEWMAIADCDFDSAKILNEAARRHYEIICYHCAQATEKYFEPKKVSNETPVYIYVVCDLVDKIHEFARGFSWSIRPDGEGYFGFSSGFNAYIEIISYRKLIEDAKIRNKIFFKKLGIE